MKYCKSCGTPLADEAMSCHVCGMTQQVASGEQTIIGSRQQPQQPGYQQGGYQQQGHQQQGYQQQGYQQQGYQQQGYQQQGHQQQGYQQQGGYQQQYQQQYQQRGYEPVPSKAKSSGGSLNTVLIGIISALVVGIIAFAVIHWGIPALSGDKKSGLDTTAVINKSIQAATNPSPKGPPVQVKVSGKDVRLRTSPSKSSGSIFTDRYGSPVHPAKGDILDCNGEEGDFYRVSYGGRTDLYVAKEYATPLYERTKGSSPSVREKRSGVPQYVRVKGVDVRLRVRPSMSSNAIYTDNYGNPIHPDKNQMLECYNEEGDFFLVDYYGTTLYISKQYADPVY